MRFTTYAAIVIGSKNILMKIYEISVAKGVRNLTEVRHEYELGKEAYFTRKISFRQTEEICEVLNDFQNIMKEYQVNNSRCYGTSAIRNAKNQIFVLNQIELRTGIMVEVLSNSELRFLMYKGIQMREIDFDRITQKNTAILDLGSGSIQISLFDKQNLYTTQNLDIGTVKIRELMESVENNALNYVSVMEEYIQYELDMFRNVHLKDKDIKYVIAIGDEIKNLNQLVPELGLTTTVDLEQIHYIFRKVRKATYQDLALQYGLSMEDARMTLPSVVIYKIFLEQTKADTIYICDTNLCDGSAIDFAQNANKITLKHDFYQDIIASAKYIGKRFRYNKVHAQYVSELAMEIFDKTAKFHGLSKRDRLILEIASILHDIGKYVNLNEPGENGYRLIMSTEIMGISHKERKEVANVVLYNSTSLTELPEEDSSFWDVEYIKISKLCAILKLANALDRGHKQKFQNRVMARKGKELIITVESNQDITLEISLFSKKAEYFSEIIGVMPILRQKRSI